MSWNLLVILAIALVGLGHFLDEQHFDEEQRGRIRQRLARIRQWLVDKHRSAWLGEEVARTVVFAVLCTVGALALLALHFWIDASVEARHPIAFHPAEYVPRPTPGRVLRGIRLEWSGELPRRSGKVVLDLGRSLCDDDSIRALYPACDIQNREMIRPYKLIPLNKLIPVKQAPWWVKPAEVVSGLAFVGIMWCSLGALAGWAGTLFFALVIPVSFILGRVVAPVLGAASQPSRKPFLYLCSIMTLLLTLLKAVLDLPAR
jgi:hypothetical protein